MQKETEIVALSLSLYFCCCRHMKQSERIERLVESLPFIYCKSKKKNKEQ